MSRPQELTHVGELAGHRRSHCHHWAHEMGARTLTLAPDEVAVRGRRTAVARCHQIAVHADAHGATRLAPLEARTLEYEVEALSLCLSLHQSRSRHHHGRHRSEE